MEVELEKITANRTSWPGVVEYADEWPLMPTPYPTMLILASYLLFVLKLGPQLMKGRAPFKLSNLLLVYNAFQVGLSIYIFVIGSQALLEVGLVESGRCSMNSPELRQKIMHAHYVYFVAKLTELLDTVFFVLRKKWNQVSFLHVYHHSIMFTAGWPVVKYEPSFSLMFMGTVNSFVHIIMYGYYGLAAFPSLKKYLWWKKYITKMQLIQFLMVIVQINWNTAVSECPISYILLTVCWFHAFLFIYLFTDFYIKSYMQKRRESNAKTTLNQNGNSLKSKNATELNNKAAKKSR